MTSQSRKLYLVEQIDANRAAVAASVGELEDKFTAPVEKLKSIQSKLMRVDPKIWKGTGATLLGLWLFKKVLHFFKDEPTHVERVAEKEKKKGLLKGFVATSLIGLAKPYVKQFLFRKASGMVTNYYVSKSSRY